MKRKTIKSNIKKASDDALKEQGSQSPSQSSEAFSVLEKLPPYIYFPRSENDFSIPNIGFLTIHKSGFNNDITWSVAYETYLGRKITFCSDWPFGAVTKMVAWLLENNYKLDERK